MKNLALWVQEVVETQEGVGVEGELQQEVVEGLRDSFDLM